MEDSPLASFSTQTSDYYRGKITAHGPNAKGMDWKDQESVDKRFEILSEAIVHTRNLATGRRQNLTVGDYGCGSGLFVDWLVRNEFSNMSYVGIDLEELMILAARELWGDYDWVKLEVGNGFPFPVDLIICSGVMNVKLQATRKEWLAGWVAPVLTQIRRQANEMAAVNFLRDDGDITLQRSDLFYTSPREISELMSDLGFSHLVVKEGYGLHEFTIFGRTSSGEKK